MTMAGCFGARNLVAVRAARIEADGSRICPNVDGAAAITGGALSFSASLRIDAGQTDLQRDGDGNVCNTRTTDDVITGVDLNLELCVLDFELIETLTGGIIAVNAGETHGWEYAKATDTVPHTIVDAWARTWDGAGAATTALAYTRLSYFNTTWVPGQITFQENALSFPLTGKGSENSVISIGPFNDIPTEFVGSFGAIWWAAAADLPADPNPDGNSCGYIDVPACTSS
jgi:hypothetical protein